MSMEGGLTGQMLLGFEDASGLILADLILQRAAGTAAVWGEVEESAALETMNIAGSHGFCGSRWSSSEAVAASWRRNVPVD